MTGNATSKCDPNEKPLGRFGIGSLGAFGTAAVQARYFNESDPAVRFAKRVLPIKFCKLHRAFCSSFGRVRLGDREAVLWYEIVLEFPLCWNYDEEDVSIYVKKEKLSKIFFR